MIFVSALVLVIVLAGCSDPVAASMLSRRGDSFMSVEDNPDTINPTLPAPAGLKVNAVAADEIRLVWNAVPGAIHYKVYCGEPNSNALIYYQIVQETSWVDKNYLEPSSTYYYKVSAVTSEGETPASSAYSTITPTSDGTPNAPTGVRTNVYDDSSYYGYECYSIVVNWNGVSGATGYTVYWGVNTNNLHMEKSYTTKCDLYPLDPGVYYIQVSATNAAGEGPRSPMITVRTH